MTSAKRHLPILLLGLVVFWSAALLAEEGVTSYPGEIGIDNPCNNAFVDVKGTNYVRVHENTRHHEGTHVGIELRFIGYGNDATGNPYRTVFIANGEFGAEAPYYDLRFHSMWIGRNQAPSFSMDGTVRVFVHSGTVQGSQITQFDTTCRNDVKSDDDKDSDADHDRHSH